MPANNFLFPNLLAAKAHAQKVVDPAVKAATNTHGRGFAYASKEEIARVAKDALSQAGLSFELRGPVEASENGWLHFRARLDWEGGSFDEWDVWWDSSGERAPGAAKLGSVMSYAHKNALLNCLNIPRETEETHRHRVDADDMQRARHQPPPAHHEPAAQPEPPGGSAVDALRSVLKDRLGCDRGSSTAVIQLVSEVNGEPLYEDWGAVAGSQDGSAHVLECINDFLTTLSPEELVRNAQIRATERTL